MMLLRDQVLSEPGMGVVAEMDSLHAHVLAQTHDGLREWSGEKPVRVFK